MISIDRLRKIKALADQGSAGEREAAKFLLEKLLQQNDLDLHSIEDEEFMPFIFKVKKGYELILLYQIIAFVTGSKDHKYSPSHTTQAKYCAFLKPSQYKEIDLLFNHYKREWKSQVDSFFTAFVMKSGLALDPGEGEGKEPTESDLYALRLMMGMKEPIKPRIQIPELS